jgi:hypothetical protein
MQAPTRRRSIEGFGITFPELKISLPRLHLPHCIHSFTESRMIIDQAQAPYVRTGYQAPAQAPREAPRETCEEQLRALQEKYNSLESKAAQLERLIDQQRGIIPPSNDHPRSLSPLQAPTPTADPASYKVSVRLSQQVIEPQIPPPPAPSFPNRTISYLKEPAVLPPLHQPSPIREPVR